MMTVMDMKLNTLISDEIVLKDHAYRLEQYGEDFFLSENGEYAQFIYVILLNKIKKMV